MQAYPLYLIMSGTQSLLFSLIFTVNMIYQAETAGLSPLQLVLVGTTLELAVLIFEVPTGIVADIYSRRLSIIIGMVMMGVGFVIEGLFPVFSAIILTQMTWGAGYTFTSGATEAWISDEIGEAAAGNAFIRASQVRNLTALVAIPLAVVIGTVQINIPIVLGGGLLIGLGIWLAVFMPETGFQPTPREDRTTFVTMRDTFSDGLNLIRSRYLLMVAAGVTLVYGLYSEGLDRLWTPHLLDEFAFPFGWQPVIWIGIIRIVSSILSIAASEVVRKRLAERDSVSLVRVLVFMDAVQIVSIGIFAWAVSFLAAMLSLWSINITRSITWPLYSSWVNQNTESRVRATVFSMTGQLNAFGQIAGGPPIGVVGSTISTRAALSASAIMLTPVLWLFARAIRQMQQPAQAAD